MHILLIDMGGRQQEALLLAAEGERMRVMIPGRGDAEEFRFIEGAWMSEGGGAMEIAAVIPVSESAWGRAEEPLRAHAGAAF